VRGGTAGGGHGGGSGPAQTRSPTYGGVLPHTGSRSGGVQMMVSAPRACSLAEGGLDAEGERRYAACRVAVQARRAGERAQARAQRRVAPVQTTPVCMRQIQFFQKELQNLWLGKL
jgi:hypothetical protein